MIQDVVGDPGTVFRILFGHTTLVCIRFFTYYIVGNYSILGVAYVWLFRVVAKALLSSFLSSVYAVVRVTSQKRPTIKSL